VLAQNATSRSHDGSVRRPGDGGLVNKADLKKALDNDGFGMTRDINAVLESTDFGVRAEFRKHFQRQQNAIIGATATAASMLAFIDVVDSKRTCDVPRRNGFCHKVIAASDTILSSVNSATHYRSKTFKICRKGLISRRFLVHNPGVLFFEGSHALSQYRMCASTE
jgi:hypothetical protein